MKKVENSKGFTLIELLIVISIIGVLSSLLMMNFIGVRQRARDAQRKTDVRQVQSALEMYRADEGLYPTTITNCASTSLKSSDCSTVYMQDVPIDPMGSSYYNSGNYCLDAQDDGSSYFLVTCLENKNDAQGVSTITEAAGCPTSCVSGIYYLVKNP
jgi:general secretion pathway protein G